jgi:hypothetical protein
LEQAESIVRNAVVLVGQHEWDVKIELNSCLAKCRYYQKKYRTAIRYFIDSSQQKDQNQMYQTSFAAGAILWKIAIENKRGIMKQHVRHLKGARYWLERALGMNTYPNGEVAKLGLAFVWFKLGNRGIALKFLHEFLTSQVHSKQTNCNGCGQCNQDGEKIPTCQKCGVVKYCDVACQRRASSKMRPPDRDFIIRHKHICPLLNQWKQVKVENALLYNFIEDQLKFLESGCWF